MLLGSQKVRLIVMVGASLIILAVAGCSTSKDKPSQKGGKGKPDASQEATNLYRKGKYDEAIDKLTAYLKENPGDYEARVLLSSSYIVTGRTSEAYTETKKVYEAKKNPDVAYQLALLADKLLKKEEAIGYLKAAADARPNSVPFHSQLAELYKKYAKYDLAIEEWNIVLKLYPSDSPLKKAVYSRIAAAYEAAGDEEKALEVRAKLEENTSAQESQ